MYLISILLWRIYSTHLFYIKQRTIQLQSTQMQNSNVLCLGVNQGYPKHLQTWKAPLMKLALIQRQVELNISDLCENTKHPMTYAQTILVWVCIVIEFVSGTQTPPSTEWRTNGMTRVLGCSVWSRNRVRNASICTDMLRLSPASLGTARLHAEKTTWMRCF